MGGMARVNRLVGTARSWTRQLGCAAALVAMAATPAAADIQVNWLATLGFFANDAVDPGNPAVPGDYIRDGSQPGAGGVLAVLIWSPDATIDPPLATGASPAVGSPAGTENDVVLNVHTGAFAPFGDYSPGTTVYTNSSFGGANLQGGFIYARIFQDLSADAGDFYNDGMIVSAVPYLFTGGEPPVQYDHNSGDDPFFGGQLDSQLVVPTGTIGDFLWFDHNGNAVQDGGEPGIGFVTIDLIDDVNGNGVIDGGEPVVASSMTDVSGAYDFTGLAAGTYLVQVTDTGNLLTGFGLTGGANPTSVVLSTGQDFDGADFGFQQQNASIGDFVWNDLNGDGVQDSGEPGIAGVTLDLVDAGGETVLDTQTTDSSGAYDFTGLPGGSYQAMVTDTNGVLTTFEFTTAHPATVNLVAGQDFNGADFGFQQGTASIGDFVWNDLNGDGVQDAGEPGIDGVTLDLIEDANANGVADAGEHVLATATTMGGGAYDFTGYASGDYLVALTDTGGVLAEFGPTTAAPSLAVNLAAGQDFDAADFGYLQQSASIGDFVWSDLNGDGVQDAGEPGIDGVTLDLIDDTNGNGLADVGEPVLATTTTTGGGAYDFNGYAAGDYLVALTDTADVLAGFAQTGGTPTDAVQLTAGQDFDDADFGYLQIDASVGDVVWNDLDGDGVQDGGEPGIDGVTLDLIDDQNGNGAVDVGEPVLASATTAGGGAYDFSGYAAGNYLVSVTDTGGVLAGFGLTGGTQPSAVVLTAGQDFDDADFGYQQQDAAISGQVWDDADGSGVVDNGETGIADVVLELVRDVNGDGTVDAGDTSVASFTTGVDGLFLFDDLPAGDYLVDATDPSSVIVDYQLTLGDDPAAVVLGLGATETADFGYRAPFCGDGIVNGDAEMCDDGDANSNTEPDACRSDCQQATCGDGVVDMMETCDEGAANSNTDADACRLNCAVATCGDGVVDAEEACDAGAANSDTEADACRLTCAAAACGDGVVDADEECDAGAANSDTEADACRLTCAAAACGDGVVDSDEECDAGSSNADTGTAECRSDCVLPLCGDGIVDADEACDAGVNNSDVASDACRTTCQEAMCGDGVVDNGEECDEGADNGDGDGATCTATCQLPPPPDGIPPGESGGCASSDAGPTLPLALAAALWMLLALRRRRTVQHG